MAKILVAEDEKSLNELICLNLKLIGHQVFSSYSGQDTLDKITNKNYDLLLLDIMLPEISGFEIKEKALDHQEESKTVRAYANQVDYVNRFIPLMNFWSNYLLSLKD